MSYVAEKVSGTKYLSVQTALEQTKISKEELDRAMALGFVSVIEVGTTRFIERSSLDQYVSTQNEKVEKEEPTVSPFVDTVEVPRKPDNAVFGQSLSRELALEKRKSLVPAVVALGLSLVALLLTLPLPKYTDESRGESRATVIDAVAPEEVRVMIKGALSNMFGL